MDSLEYEPVAKPKPVRGREMRTAVIPKGPLETVAAKARGESVVEELMRTEPDEPEIYHEGYIDGKLYLVPDTNLQAMRDIVNFKMRRRHSTGVKPQTSMEEPTQYKEFSSKLETLLRKIDNLTGGSLLERCSGFREEVESPTASEQPSQEDLRLLEARKSPPAKNKSTKESYVEPIPPILDENIKYKRVKSKQRFRLVLSGHLKPGKKPLYIIHTRSNIPKVLEEHIPDFKSHRTDGECDIYLAGKFFSKDILEEATATSNAFLDLPPHKIFIDETSSAHYSHFQQSFHFGKSDIVLEGGFLKNKKSAKCTPVLSMEIHKNIFSNNSEYWEAGNESLSHDEPVYYSYEDKTATFSEQPGKHVHYKSEGKEEIVDEPELDKQRNTGVFGKMIGRCFEKSKTDGKTMLNRASLTSLKHLKSKKEPRLRSVMKEKRKREERKKMKGTKVDDLLKKREDKALSFTPATISVPKTVSVSSSGEGKQLETKMHRRKKEDKNQAIVENPILAQMQEFFLA